MDYKKQLERTKNRLELYYEAEEAVLTSQSYSLGGKSLTRANLADIRAMIGTLETKQAELEAYIKYGSRRRAFRVIPRDL